MSCRWIASSQLRKQSLGPSSTASPLYCAIFSCSHTFADLNHSAELVAGADALLVDLLNRSNMAAKVEQNGGAAAKKKGKAPKGKTGLCGEVRLRKLFTDAFDDELDAIMKEIGDVPNDKAGKKKKGTAGGKKTGEDDTTDAIVPAGNGASTDDTELAAAMATRPKKPIHEQFVDQKYPYGELHDYPMKQDE